MALAGVIVGELAKVRVGESRIHLCCIAIAVIPDISIEPIGITGSAFDKVGA